MPKRNPTPRQFNKPSAAWPYTTPEVTLTKPVGLAARRMAQDPGPVTIWQLQPTIPTRRGK